MPDSIPHRAFCGQRPGRHAASLLLVLLAACSPEGIIGDAPLPSDVSDPAAAHTPAGAIGAYYATIADFADAFDLHVPAAGLLSDELRTSEELGQPPGLEGGFAAGSLDRRMLPEATDAGSDGNLRYTQEYAKLQDVRANANTAIGLLAYAPDSSPALGGHMRALEGYADVMLAELFCSGIPLSTRDFDGDYTLQPGASTTDVLHRAVALFDTALTLSGDSVRILNLARVGRARALLGLGEFAAAADAVTEVPDDFRYYVRFTSGTLVTDGNFARISPAGWDYAVSNYEGENGLDYRSSSDPRTVADSTSTNRHGVAIHHPNKYAVTGDSPIVLADGIEARLIEAEAALRSGDAKWLTILNTLRTDGTFTTQPDAEDSSKTDTLWHAGIAGVAGLAQLEDPESLDARVDLLFHERAFWLFLTGHRQGDLRRLIRQYRRGPESVYPTGSYSGAGLYGGDVTAPIPSAERAYNPLFTGCLSRGG